MRLLIQVKQTNNANKATIEPLSSLNFVEEIHIIRDYPGHYIPKVQFHCIPEIFTKIKLTRVPFKFLYMLYYGIKIKPDAIIGFDIYPHSFNAFLCGKIFRKPIISSIRGELKSSLMPKNRFVSNLTLAMFKRCNYVMTTGNRVKKYLISKGVDKNKVIILPNSIDTKRFYPKKVNKMYDIISVGRLSKEKRLDILLEIVYKIKKIKKDIKVGIVGDGPEKNRLKELCSELNLNQNIQFLGFKNKTENYFNQGKVYVLTSDTEGLPQAMLEAMACGLPCIVPNIGDIRDVAIHDYNSVIIKKNTDIKKFKKAILKLLEDKKFYKKLSENAPKIREKFGYTGAINVWTKVLRR